MSIASFKFCLDCNRVDKKRDKNLAVPQDVEILKDIPYADGGKYNLLDVYYPKGTNKKQPVIVNIHGGGYVYGTKEVYFHYGVFLAQQGFTVVNFNYHLAPKTKFPTQLTEINMVMGWVLKNKDRYYMDADNLFIVGDSAGAQLASHYCAIYSNREFAKLFPFEVPKDLKICGVALNCGLYDISAESDLKNKYKEYLGNTRKKRNDMLKVLSNITADFPPSYVMSAQYDYLKEKAEPMHKLLTERGVESVCKIYGKEGQEYMAHVFHCNMNLEEAKVCNRDECDFFKAHVKL